MVQTPRGPIPLEQAGQMLQEMDQQMQEMGAQLKDAATGIEKARIDADAKVHVAEINAVSKSDVAELQGLIQLLVARLQPPPQIAAEAFTKAMARNPEPAPQFVPPVVHRWKQAQSHSHRWAQTRVRKSLHERAEETNTTTETPVAAPAGDVAAPVSTDAPADPNAQPNDRDDKGRFRNPVQPRIDELTRKTREAEREAAYWRGRAQSAEKPKDAAAPPAKPTPDKFDDYGAFVEALADWKADEKIKANNDANKQESPKSRPPASAPSVGPSDPPPPAHASLTSIRCSRRAT
jgi:hypothetical protein